MRRWFRYFILFIGIYTSGFAQSKVNQFLKPSDTLNTSRRNAVIISEASIGATTLIGLNTLWYKDYPRSKFHTINDFDQWMQMDKLGHAFTSYQLGRLGAEILQWSGVSKKNQLVYGATLGFAFLTSVEIFDGFSEEWGFSWSDIGANAVGTGLFIGQELLWNEQRIQLKYSFHRTKYAQLRPDKLGDNFLEEVLKDYNGQTYWLSANVSSFFNKSKIPSWLNVAVGYGAHGMLTGLNAPVNNLFTSQDRFRQYFLSFDVNLCKINTKSRVLKTIFSVLNVIKIPLPTIEFNSKKEVVFHLFYL